MSERDPGAEGYRPPELAVFPEKFVQAFVESVLRVSREDPKFGWYCGPFGPVWPELSRLYEGVGTVGTPLVVRDAEAWKAECGPFGPEWPEPLRLYDAEAWKAEWEQAAGTRSAIRNARPRKAERGQPQTAWAETLLEWAEAYLAVNAERDGAVALGESEAAPEVRAMAIDRRVTIDAFISKLGVAGRKITRTDIWTVAGYRNATEFERFQRDDDRTTKSAVANFTRVLRMKPEDFSAAVAKKSASK